MDMRLTTGLASLLIAGSVAAEPVSGSATISLEACTLTTDDGSYMFTCEPDKYKRVVARGRGKVHESCQCKGLYLDGQVLEHAINVRPLDCMIDGETGSGHATVSPRKSNPTDPDAGATANMRIHCRYELP